MSDFVEIHIPGETVAKGRPRFSGKGKRPYTPGKTRWWENFAAICAKNGIVWCDDSQVVSSYEWKYYGSEPGVYVRIEPYFNVAPANVGSRNDFWRIVKNDR